MSDKYSSMTELEDKTEEGIDWERSTREKNSAVLISAIHGGAIEPGTTEIADLISEKGGFDFYNFKGIKSKNNEELHVTSHHYDEPVLNKLISEKEYALAIHGCKGEDEVVYIGGKDDEIISKLVKNFQKIGVKTEDSPSNLSGVNDNNIINCCKSGAGVQLELTSGLRKKCFKNAKYNKKSREDKDNWSDFMDDFTNQIVAAFES